MPRNHNGDCDIEVAADLPLVHLKIRTKMYSSEKILLHTNISKAFKEKFYSLATKIKMVTQ